MRFGYALAVIAGFLLTAVRNWTALPAAYAASIALSAALWCSAFLVFVISYYPILTKARLDGREG